ncbi:MAG: NADP oxidoreductase, partial [Candidatus Omnitrophica bacterium]|nr:NADP oxidoreductase [Candidatus Omnitrophota bacterium]
VETSRDLDNKTVFEFVGRGPHKKIAINPDAKLVDTQIDITDKVVDSCPVGSILKKRVGFEVPVGKRKYDQDPHPDSANNT